MSAVGQFEIRPATPPDMPDVRRMLREYVRWIGLDLAFQALADPTRRGMLARLSRAPASVSELAAHYRISLPAVMQHLQLLEASGLVFRDRAAGGVVTYVPGLARLDDGVVTRLAASDLVLVDGTFWRDDELARLGISDRTARDMGHTPLAGPGGILEMLAGLARPRKVLVHINNTNPILLEDSPERAQVVHSGVEVAYDGLEAEL